MAKYECTMCGKTLGLMETISREFPDDGKNRGLCGKCHQYFVNTVLKRVVNISDPETFKKTSAEISEQVKAEKGTAGYEYVKDYFLYKEREFVKDEKEEQWISCPLCQKIRDPKEAICNNCGYIYSDKPVFNREDYIRAAMQRFGQYQKNPLYEYKVETVSDSAFTGTLKTEKLQRILAMYSMDGWRLHTAITNETGKTMLSAAGVGANATVDQTILIFERCIKGQD